MLLKFQPRALVTAIVVTTLTIAPNLAFFPSARAQRQQQTWEQFAQSSELDYIRKDFNLPNEFKDGFVYFDYGSNQVKAYILKKGLVVDNSFEVTENHIRTGQAIVLYWNLGNSALQYAGDPTIRFPRKDTGCLENICLTASFLNEAEIAEILRDR